LLSSYLTGNFLIIAQSISYLLEKFRGELRTKPVEKSIGQRLEQYTIKRPQEVLLVEVEIAGEPDQIVIFKGFSSSLMRPTAFDPDVPILSEEAKIISIDRLASPYNPAKPRYIQQGLTLEEMEVLLAEVSL
jgi:hypothetical protein